MKTSSTVAQRRNARHVASGPGLSLVTVGDLGGVAPGAGDGARDGVEDSSGAPFRQVVGRTRRTVAIERAPIASARGRSRAATSAASTRAQHGTNDICSAVARASSSVTRCLGRRPVAFIEARATVGKRTSKTLRRGGAADRAPAADVSLLLPRNLRAPVALICAERAP